MAPESAGAPILAPRERLDLRVASNDGFHSLRTQLERIDLATGRLVVTWPMAHQRLFPMRPGQTVVVELSRPDDALYTRDTLLESATSEEPPRLFLRPTGDWQRWQRRHTIRHIVGIRPSQAMRLVPSGERQPFTAVVGDLSAGGMRVSSSIELEVGERLELTFGTPSGGSELRLRVIVVRVGLPTSAGGESWDVGCQFVEPSVAERDQIVQFILTQQGAFGRGTVSE